jgi:hypothetical protein
LNSAKKLNKRERAKAIKDAEEEIDEAEEDVKAAKNVLEARKKDLDFVKEESAEAEERANLKAQQDYEKTISSIGNIEQNIELRVKKVKLEGEKKKRNLLIELDNLEAKTSALKEKLVEFDKCRDDVKEIALALGKENSAK